MGSLDLPMTLQRSKSMAVAGQNFFLRLMIEYGFFSGNKLCQKIYLL